MAVKASATITLTQYRDTQSVTRYYKLQPAGSSAPLRPNTKPPSSDWTDSEPACDISKELYFCDLTIFSNGEWEYSKVSKSTSYEAAKQAYNKAQGAKDSIDNLEIGGRNYFSKKTDSAFNEDNEFTLANYQNTGSFTQFKNLTVPMSYFVGKRCILSFDCISPNGSTPISVYNNNGNPRYRINTSGIISPINNEWVHQELIITVTDLGDSSSYNEAQSNKIEIYCPAQMGCKVRNVKLEIGNRATDWTPAPEDVDSDIDDTWEKADDAQTSIDNLEIGGRNLFLNTGEAVSWNDYLITTYKYANEPLKEGEIYTATICVTPAENLSEIKVYFSQGYLAPVSFSITEMSKQIISKTFTMAYYDGRTPDIYPSYGYAQLYRFPNDGTVTGNTTVHWFKIEKGNRATDWTPAPEDIESRTTVLEAASAKELVRNGFAEFTNDPKLTLGKTTSPWKVVVKNDGIFLQKSSNDVASLSKETSSEETTLRADNARLANVKFRSANGGGKLGIVAQSNGHVSLKEI